MTSCRFASLWAARFTPPRSLVTASCLLALCFSGMATPAPGEELTETSWKYTLKMPPEGWQEVGFDASDWKEAPGGFGTPGTPGARIGTAWRTSDIWLRRHFDLPSVPEKPALLIHHDEDAQVYINGQQVASLSGWTNDYQVIPLGEQHRQVLKEGKNLLAVHCSQSTGGQFIDVHVVDAENVPTLPQPKRNTTPFQSDLITQWGADVTADNTWTEYPRPQLVRENWVNLNGKWDYAIAPVDQQETPTQWAGKILVPYPLESKLSGVQRLLNADESLWYHRTFQATPTQGKRTLLHFEAVDYRCEVSVNGQVVGSHQGGNDPFVFDVTDAVQSGENRLVVRVEDETEGWQLRGKQVLNPEGIWYTQVSGIWQTVWLEEVPASYIEDLVITTDASPGAEADSGTIHVQPNVAGQSDSTTVRVTVKDGETPVATAQGSAGQRISVNVSNAKLWSPDSPQLYAMDIVLLDEQNRAVDRVHSYAGIRTIGKTRDEDGDLRFTLNGERIFHWGPLDQGWWPDGLLTPPSDEAMVFEIKFLKEAGFNMIRKHIKVEPRRYYYHCDRLGMIVWQDQVSAGHGPEWTRLQPNPQDAQWPEEHHEQFMLEFERMIDTLENHPSIVVWVPFNEAWGQHRTMEVGQWISERDPSRLINIASGGNFWPVGDIVDMHNYPHPAFPFAPERYQDFIKVVGEFGGHGYPVEGHLWDADRRNWGYGGLPENKQEYRERYVKSLEMLNELRGRGIAGGVYTQTTDVEGEINGLLTYDRKVTKIPAEELAELHERLFQPAPEGPVTDSDGAEPDSE